MNAIPEYTGGENLSIPGHHSRCVSRPYRIEHFSLDSTMARTKQTARKNTGGRKPRHWSLKTKVRTQTDEVEFVKVVTPPKPPAPSSAASAADPPICIDITGEDEREV